MASKYINNSECVVIEWLFKFPEVQRHLDIILKQLKMRVGRFNRVHIIDNPIKPMAVRNGCTFAYLELEDTTKHDELVSLIDCYRFHGHKWSVTKGSFYFTGMDFAYAPRPTKCRQCEHYFDDLLEWENKQKQSTVEKPFHAISSSLSSDNIKSNQSISITIPDKAVEVQCPRCNLFVNASTFCSSCGHQLQFNNANNSKQSLMEASNQSIKQLTMPQACSLCDELKAPLVHPIVKAENKSKCTHAFCVPCFNSSAIYQPADKDDNPIWDGFPVVSFSYRFKSSPNLVWSCQACRAINFKKQQ